MLRVLNGSSRLSCLTSCSLPVSPVMKSMGGASNASFVINEPWPSAKNFQDNIQKAYLQRDRSPPELHKSRSHICMSCRSPLKMVVMEGGVARSQVMRVWYVLVSSMKPLLWR